MVEWKKLGEITRRNKGIPITAGQMSELASKDGNVRVFAAGSTIADIDESRLPKKCAHKLPSIIVKSRGYIDFEFYEKPFTHKNEMWSYSFDNKQEGKFIYYFLTTQTDFFRNIAKANSVKLPQLCVADTDNFSIPIPSLEEQARIVGILDTFTSAIDNLKEQIAQRRKQYEYYRDQLYYASKADLLEASRNGEAIVKSLDELGKFTRGRRFVRTDIVPEGVPCIHYGDMYTYYGVSAEETPTHLTKKLSSKLRFAKNGDVVIVAAGENDLDIGVGVAWLGKEPVVVHDACFIYEHKMSPKYLSHFMRSRNYHQQIRMGVVDGKICSISAKELGRALIAVPPLSEQQRIVSILDAFEASIQNLEAQLKEREKQYEYYRNKLLTFE